ncbi:BRD4-interacting chromatin-remodeling complex-associated protein-like isoform X2 [Hydractinia symbiolongicarpus]|nr:BRD4-interacting chromatin-remodeling complex-associated protein-like isoform X2 [Hydractinia symbiolongicarpus]
MANPNNSQTSFQEEFNRLTFLASIATGSSATTRPIGSTSQAKNSLNTSFVPNTSTANSFSVLRGSTSKPTTDQPLVNGSNRTITTVASSTTNVGKINSLLINSGLRNINSAAGAFRNQNIVSASTQRQPISHSQFHTTGGPRAVSQMRPQLQNPRMPTPRLQAQNQQLNSTPPKTILFSPYSPNKTSSAQQLTRPSALQQNMTTNGLNMTPTTNTTTKVTISSNSQSMNPTLIISQNSSPSKMATQSIATSSGQTILLPANFAGMSGKVFIVNNAGKAPQTIAIAPTSKSLQQLQQQTQVLPSQQSNIQTSQQVLLLPNPVPQNASDKPNMPMTSLQQHQQQVVNNALQMIAAQHNSPQQLKIQPSSVTNQLAPKQMQSVSLSSFQNIRPKSFLPQTKTIQPKSSNSVNSFSQGKTSVNPASTQAIRLSHFPTQGKKSISMTQNNQANVLLPSTASRDRVVSTAQASPLMSQFDKTMSHHLQTLEKTDPHLFLHKGNKLVINQFQKSSFDKTFKTMQPSANGQQQQVGSILQQQTLNRSNIQTSVSGLTSQLKLQSNLQSQFNTSQQHSMASQHIVSTSPPVSIATQVLTMPQKQQAALQSILKQQLQQQQLQNKVIVGKPQQNILKQQTQVTTQQILARQQQLQLQQQQQLLQQKLDQKNAVSQPQLFMMQQKILQQVQNQQKISPQLINVSPKIDVVQQSTVQPNAPLKLLSSLTNMVNSSLNSKTINTSSVNVNAMNKTTLLPGLASGGQVGMSPVLVQLPNGAHVLNTTQLTPAQIIELQKSLQANMNKQSIASTTPLPGQSIVSTVTNNIQNHITGPALSAAAKAALQNASIRPALGRSAFSLQQGKNIKVTGQQQQQQQSLQKQQLASSIKEQLAFNKNLQEQLKHLTPTQRDLIIKQYAAGKININSSTLSGPVLLASILKRDIESSANSSLPKPNILQRKSESSKIANQAIKRSLDAVKTEAEEHPLAKKWKSALQTDQLRYVSPQYRTPFKNVKDAITRLLPYHICQDDDDNDDDETKENRKHDFLLQTYAKNVQDRKNWMLAKFNHLLLEEDQITSPTADEILIRRLYASSEQERFELQKSSISEGRAFVVKNEARNELECVEVGLKEEEEISINISEKQRLDNRLLIAHKDMANMQEDSDNELGDDDDGLNEDDAVVDEDDYDMNEHDGVTAEEEIEVEEIAETFECKEDIELAAATTNLLADLQQDDDYQFDFML